MATTYGTLVQVKAQLNNDPAINDTRAQEILDEVAAELDAMLISAGYVTVPVTGAKDLVLVRGFVVPFAAARVYRLMYQNDDAPEHIESWESRWEKFIDRLLEGTLRLPDQQLASGGLKTGNIVLWPTSDRDAGY